LSFLFARRLIMNDVQSRLAQRFRKQQAFTAGYSPLYARLFGIVADWLAAAPGDDPLTVVAGVMREPLPIFVLIAGGAKIFRYLVLAAVTLGWLA